MKKIYIANLVWNTSFMPENILVIASSVEQAVQLIHKKYKEGNEISFIRIDSLQMLNTSVSDVIM
jgi:hypothetical protein